MNQLDIATADRHLPSEADRVVLDGLPDGERSLLIVDDDGPLCSRLARAMERRGFLVSTAESVAAGIAAADATPPAFALVDLRLGDGNGLDVVSAIQARGPMPLIRRKRPGSSNT